MCLDNYENPILLCYQPQSFYYPSSIAFIQLNKNNGNMIKYNVGTSLTSIKPGKILLYQNQFWTSCTFTDSITFSNQQKIKFSAPTNVVKSVIMQLDTHFNILKYTRMYAYPSFDINDVCISNNMIYTTGLYRNYLYIQDTLRLSSSGISKMFLSTFHTQLQNVWNKQEIQCISNCNSYGMTNGYKLSSDNLYICELAAFANNVILNTDTFQNSSLILLQYQKNTGQYVKAEKIAGIVNNNRGLAYDPLYSHILVSTTFNSPITVCQNTLTSIGQTDSYIAILDKITDVNVYEKQNISTIFPNPAYFEIFTPYEKNTPYQIIDVTGKIITMGLIRENGSIPLQNIENGFYILLVSYQSDVHTHAFIVQH